MGKTLPLISVIVPVCNVERYIEKCVLSLVNQTYKRCEFIFVDDGSTDHSIKKLKTVDDKRIKIISQENSGVSVARNKGLDIARGKYVVFVDSDDYVAQDYVEYLYGLITFVDGAEFAYSTELFKTKTDKQIKNDEIIIIDGKKSTGILLSPDVTVGSYNKIYSREVIETNKLRFKPELYYGEGLNFIVRMSLVSKKIVVGKRKILYYRKNNETSATTKYNNGKYHNGLKSLAMIRSLIDWKDDFVVSMYKLHLSNFYLGAITQIIENNKMREYRDDYESWNKSLKSDVGFIIRNKYISIYRKCMIIVGAYLPHLIAAMDKSRRKKIIRNSVD